MKTSKVLAMAMVALALSATPALAQRGGGGGSRGGGSSHSSSVSHSSGSHSSSSSRGSSYSSSSSRSSSSSSRSSYSSPSRSSSSSSRSSAAPSRSMSSSRSSAAPSRAAATSSRSGAPSRSSAAPAGRSASHGGVRGGTPAGRGPAPTGVRSGAPGNRGAATASTSGRPSSRGVRTTPESRPHGYARPGHPGPMPPSHRPIHPAPYFHHPWHGYVVHCHPIFWDPIPPRPWYWPGFWVYCHSYWYDYHVTDVVVVHDYVQQTYNVDLVTYGISGDIMYAIVRDHGDTYLQVYDKDDHLLAEQTINHKYCQVVIDADNGGCWISKKHDKDALLFIWVDGQLLIYEAD